MTLMEREASRQRIFIVLAVFSAIILLTNLALVTGTDFGFRTQKLRVPEVLKDAANLLDDINFDDSREVVDHHPIASLMQDAAQRFRNYDSARSKTFAQAVKTYRSKYGRHPPPGFDKWYIFARDRGIYHLDDFDQIYDDLRPFWSIPPADLRLLVHGMLAEDSGPSGLAGIVIKDGKPEAINSKDSWRSQIFISMLEVFAKDLPDMEIAMNRLDQPRVVVEWETLQAHLKKEEEGRVMPPEVRNEFTPRKPISNDTILPKAEWFGAPGKPYMNLAGPACPPDSPARNPSMSTADADKKYKIQLSGGLVSNFNTSSDLCTVGPTIADLHGFLFSASSIVATKKLVPVFGECKVNVNNDILFPANMYYKRDERYEYAPDNDVIWEDKTTTMFWRGITSGGVQNKENWRRLHRHRLVLMTNSSNLENTQQTEKILNWYNEVEKTYAENPNFHPAVFAEKYTDVGFPELKWCVPDNECGWLKEFFTPVNQTALTDQFVYKYLVDIDGHSFSGRWNAFLKSRSMGIKATIFREWHDSRLFAWHHFAPMDNRFDDLYTLLTYFIGLGSSGGTGPRTDFYVPSHDFEAKKMANTARDWASKVLRREDIEIYMFRLMLEYARLLDDDRDRIGYGGDGAEMPEKWG